MRTAFALFSALILSACGSAQGTAPSADRKGETRSYDLDDFDSVSLKGSDEVKVVQGASFMVTARGSSEGLDQLELSVEDGTLVVRRKNGSGQWMGDKGVVVTVVMPHIRSASLAGSGDMSVEGTADDRFKASLAGSGDLSINQVRALQSEFSVAGSGDLKLSGATQQTSFSLAGSGGIEASKLEIQKLDLSVAGSGDVTAQVSGHADVSIAGSGDVRISGTQDCTISKTGSGDVTCS